MMYPIILVLHSMLRWLVLGALMWAIFRAWEGLRNRAVFTKSNNRLRHWTATLAHIQMMLGILLYAHSPTVKQYFACDSSDSFMDGLFFGLIHMGLMLLSIVCLTIGSARAKRQASDLAKYKTMFIWFVISLVIILIAIPWPFSPLAQRPLFRIP